MSIFNKKRNILKVFVIFIVFFQLLTPLTIGMGIKNKVEASTADGWYFQMENIFYKEGGAFGEKYIEIGPDDLGTMQHCGEMSAIKKGGACYEKKNGVIVTEGETGIDPKTGKFITSTDPTVFNPNQTISPKAKPTETNYTLLAPLLDGSSTGITTIDTSTPCAFGKYMNMMIKLFIGISAVLAMIMIIKGGFEYMTSSLPSEKESGKGSITQAILGLLIALGAWVILYTLNPNLLNFCGVGKTLPEQPIVTTPIK